MEQRNNSHVIMDGHSKSTIFTPVNQQFLLQKAIGCLKAKQWHEAIECLEKLLRYDDENFLAWYNLAVAHHKLGHLDQCKEAMEKVKLLVQHPEHERWHEKVSLLEREIKKAEETIKKMRRSRSLDECPPEDQLRVGQLFETRGFLNHALRIYQKVVDVHSDFLPAWQAFIRLTVRLGEKKLLFNQLNKMLDRQFPDRLVLRIFMAYFEHVRDLGDMNNLLTVVGKKENHVGLLVDLARACLHQNKNKLVITILEQALQQKPLQSEQEIRKMLGIAHRRCGAYREALHHLKIALTLDFNDASVLYQLGLCYQLLGDLDRSIFHYRHCLEVKPIFTEAWNNLAVVLWKKGLVGEARDCFDKLIAMGLDTEQTWFNRALFLLEQGHIDETVKCLKKTLEKNPDHQKARDLLNRLLKERIFKNND